ncbi:hypothetical protein [Enterococcus sp. AZ196]|uniref:hypothetical protein n=1 Tax=Enterococcus sp. AZ196 TaxID=2774659 RepID=UPI003D2C5842
MSKKIYNVVEVIKLFVLSWFVILVSDKSIESKYFSEYELVLIGRSFLIMLVSLIVGSILLEIFISFFIPMEVGKIGEWEKIVNNNVLRNFSYALSLFLFAIMVSFASNAQLESILNLLKLGFFFLITIVNLTKAYYYGG